MDRELKKIYIIKAINKMENKKCLDFIYGFIKGCIDNKGRKIKAYVSYPDSSAWQNKVYEGIIEEAGRDHLIIRDNTNNLWYLIRIIYLNYVEFMEPIIYSHSFSEKTY